MTIVSYQAERDASDYFNSLPIEERQKLAPLLEHYRLMGIQEAALSLHAVTAKLNKRADDIVARSEAIALEETR